MNVSLMMKKLICLNFEEFSLIHYALCLAISETSKKCNGIFTDESTLNQLDKYDSLLKKLCNTFSPERKPNFD